MRTIHTIKTHEQEIQGRMAEPAKARVKIAWTLSLFSQADPGSSYGSA